NRFAGVAQISNLCTPKAFGADRRAYSLRDLRIIQRTGRFARLPIGNRRYSRLEICATRFMRKRFFPHAVSEASENFRTRSQRICGFGVVTMAWLLAAGCVLGATPKSRPEPVLLVVMDPLAKELACACVKGYGQRDYRKIATRLEKALKQRVSTGFSDDLGEVRAGITPGR